MKRRSFLKRFGIGTAALAAIPATTLTILEEQKVTIAEDSPLPDNAIEYVNVNPDARHWESFDWEPVDPERTLWMNGNADYDTHYFFREGKLIARWIPTKIYG